MRLNCYYYYYYYYLTFLSFSQTESEKDAEPNALLLTNETRIAVSAVITQPLKVSKRERDKESNIVHLHPMKTHGGGEWSALRPGYFNPRANAWIPIK